MYICICNAVNEDRIRQAAADGARSLADLQTMLGVATGCGGCAAPAAECLEEALSAEPAAAPEPLPGFQPA